MKKKSKSLLIFIVIIVVILFFVFVGFKGFVLGGWEFKLFDKVIIRGFDF